MKVMLAKQRGNVLVPADPEAEKLIASIKIGDGISVEAKKARNIRFHRKFFTLLNLAFDIWEPVNDMLVRNQPINKCFEKFREDILILAGHYEAVFGINGNVRLRAKSISFARCDEYEFNDIYRSVLTVVWEKVLRFAQFPSEQEVERVVNLLIAYE